MVTKIHYSQGSRRDHAFSKRDGKSFKENPPTAKSLKCSHNGKTEMDDSLSSGDDKAITIPKLRKRTKKTRIIRWLTKKFSSKSKTEKHPNNEGEKSVSPALNMETSELTLYMNAVKQTNTKFLSKSTSDLHCSNPRNLLKGQDKNPLKKSNSAKSLILDPALLCLKSKKLSKPTYLPVDYTASNLGRRWRSCIGLENYNITHLDISERTPTTMTLSSRNTDSVTPNHSKTGLKISTVDQCLMRPTESDTHSTGSEVSSNTYCKFRTNFDSGSSLSMCDEYRGPVDDCLSPILSHIPVSEMPSLSDNTCTMDYLKFLPEHDCKERTKQYSSSNFLHPKIIPCSLMSSPLSSSKYPISCSPISSLSSSECDSAIDVFSPDEDWQDLKRAAPCKTPPRTDYPSRAAAADFMPPQVIITDYDDSVGQPSEDGSDLLHSLDLLGTTPRKYSSSSIASDLSDYSTISSSSNEERTEKNHWKKIKNAVQWTPFIQHFKKQHKYPWIQLAGHQGCFQAGDPGTILKKLNVNEQNFYNIIENDCLKKYVPESRGEIIKDDGEKFLQLEDLLTGFNSPCVMDIKMGVRTYLEEELVKARENPKLRTDMFQKMVEIDPNAPTPEELAQKAITKPRYMQWRETISSSASLGFRIEGIKRSNGDSSKDFKRTKTREQVQSVLKNFTDNDLSLLHKYYNQLKILLTAIESSTLFKDHEVIGSSLLFIHDRNGKAGIWLIDFGKTVHLPCNVTVTHRNPWAEGNHEDGYLFGMDNLISIVEELL